MRTITRALLLHASEVIQRILNVPDGHSSDDSPEENELTEIHGSLNELHARSHNVQARTLHLDSRAANHEKRLATNEDAIGSLAQRIGDLNRRVETLTDNHGHMTNRLDELTNPKTFQKDIFARLDKIETIAIRNLAAKIGELEKQPLAASHNHLCKATDERFTALEGRIETHEGRLDIQRDTVHHLAETIGAQSKRIDGVSQRQNTTDGNLDVVVKAAATHEGLVSTSDALHVVEKKVTALESAIIRITSFIGGT